MGEQLNIVNAKVRGNVPSGSGNGKPEIPPNPFPPEYIDPGDKTGAAADQTQQSLSHRDAFVNYFDKAYYDQFMKNNPNSFMARSILPWLNDQIHMNDRRGNINGKDFYTTRNLARLADRFNNDFTFAGGQIASHDAQGHKTGHTAVEWEQNPQLNTMEQRQYEDNRGIANALRQNDVDIMNKINAAVPSAYAQAQQQMVQYRDYIGQLEADMNKIVRDASVKVNYTLPWDQYFAEVVNYFVQNVPRYLDVKLADFLKGIPNDVWRAFYAQVTRAGVMPNNEQVLMSSFWDTIAPAMRNQGASQQDILKAYYKLTYGFAQMQQDYMLRNQIYTLGQTYGMYENMFNGKGNLGSLSPTSGLPLGYENAFGE